MNAQYKRSEARNIAVQGLETHLILSILRVICLLPSFPATAELLYEAEYKCHMLGVRCADFPLPSRKLTWYGIKMAYNIDVLAVPRCTGVSSKDPIEGGCLQLCAR